jgi:hypothetical protein
VASRLPRREENSMCQMDGFKSHTGHESQLLWNRHHTRIANACSQRHPPRHFVYALNVYSVSSSLPRSFRQVEAKEEECIRGPALGTPTAREVCYDSNEWSRPSWRWPLKQLSTQRVTVASHHLQLTRLRNGGRAVCSDDPPRL